MASLSLGLTRPQIKAARSLGQPQLSAPSTMSIAKNLHKRTLLTITKAQMEEAVEVFSLFDPTKEGHIDIRSVER